jgi:hypothetical protein
MARRCSLLAPSSKCSSASHREGGVYIRKCVCVRVLVRMCVWFEGGRGGRARPCFWYTCTRARIFFNVMTCARARAGTRIYLHANGIHIHAARRQTDTHISRLAHAR